MLNIKYYDHRFLLQTVHNLEGTPLLARTNIVEIN